MTGKMFEVFQLITDITDVDFPLCDICTEIVIADLSKRLDELRTDNSQYEEFERRLDEEESFAAKADFNSLHAEIKKVFVISLFISFKHYVFY